MYCTFLRKMVELESQKDKKNLKGGSFTGKENALPVIVSVDILGWGHSGDTMENTCHVIGRRKAGESSGFCNGHVSLQAVTDTFDALTVQQGDEGAVQILLDGVLQGGFADVK